MRFSLWISVLAIACAVAGCAGTSASQQQPKDVSLQIRLAADVALPGYQKHTMEKGRLTVYVSPTVELTEMDIKDARVLNVQTGTKDKPVVRPGVAVEMTSEGKRKLQKITEKRDDMRLAVFVNNSLMTAPYIGSPIRDGRMLIHTNMTTQEAHILATALSGRKPDVFSVPR